MSYMVDRVATAIYDADRENGSACNERPYYVRLARAAMGAMVEPTEEMVRAAHASTAGWLNLPGPRSALSQALSKHAHRYRAMVRKAIST